MDRADVCVLLPTMNEERTVGDVVRDFRDHGFERVLVVDGGSTDGTRELAREAGARVVEQRGTGKGQAVRQAVAEEIDAPVVLMADADGTYRAADAGRMVAPIAEGRADHVIGDRFADMEDGAMTRLNGVGNRLTNGAFRLIHGRDFADILSGYRAFTRESFDRYSLSADGFGIETELAVEAVKHGTHVEVVPVTYGARPDESETNLHPVKDGARIFLTLYRLAKTNNPLFYFGSVGVASLFAGLAVAGYVAYEWFVVEPPVSHEALAVVAAAGIILGVQLVMFGVLSDIVVAVNREQTRRLEELAEQLSGADEAVARGDWETEAKTAAVDPDDSEREQAAQPRDDAQ
ncbi:S-layer glycoprotein N-glycosyltransferase AglJ [Halosegnis marinus]|uniref:S-layer glycoprotein N-glycosyltransferase AglJ n=1 Tax=Halosegnis marinus TaxID=3034023 RepID=A0ABD5ZKP6_9EURY|nr:S-layer glycoprotein N-glycosyltransferase AglJ [Halosegnis sp. DT85]